MPRLMNPIALLTLVLAGTATATAKPIRYELDPVHSRIVFSVGHDGYSHALGTFSRPHGVLWFDPDDWRNSRVEVLIDANTLDLGDAEFNARISKRDYLDASQHPQARFVSTSVEPVSDTTARVHGTLSIRGSEAPVTLDVTLNRMARSAYSLRRTVGFSATATLSRAAFGMTAHAKAVDDAVHLRIEVEATRTRPSKGSATE